uniref:STMN1 protein n=1 Tax=Globodera pallida TaxID=36090 RepID=A0A183CMV4_GLOPA
PPISPPIAEYRSPDGEYEDVTKKWEQPTLEELEKKLGVGRLIKMPEFKKKQIQQQRQQAESAGDELGRKEPWMKAVSANV